jgi:hypothetical protein
MRHISPAGSALEYTFPSLAEAQARACATTGQPVALYTARSPEGKTEGSASLQLRAACEGDIMPPPVMAVMQFVRDTIIKKDSIIDLDLDTYMYMF